MKLLVIRFSSIGDIVLTTPVVRCIKQQKPDTVVHYLTKASFRPLLANNPHIDKLFYLEDDLDSIIQELKKEKYDYIIDLHHNLRTGKIKRTLKVKSYSFNKLNIRKWLLVNFKINTMPDKSIVERYLETVKPLGIHNDGQGLDYFIPYTKLKSNDIPMSHWAGYIGCVIGGSYPTKKLPVAKWKEFLEQIPYPVILFGGPEDKEEGAEIASIDPIKIYNSCGKFSINESAYLVKHARIIVSNDTGLMHIATAFQKTVFSLWGNTSPEFGMFPYYGGNNLRSIVSSKSIIFENEQLSCHPCSKLGYKSCPKGHFKCMNDLNMIILASQVKKNWDVSQP
jgi:ADP-heptose:LPS heptosyltransferase